MSGWALWWTDSEDPATCGPSVYNQPGDVAGSVRALLRSREPPLVVAVQAARAVADPGAWTYDTEGDRYEFRRRR